MSLSVLIYNPKTGLEEFDTLVGLKDLPPESNVWVDISTDDEGLIHGVASFFGLHELAVEDCLTPGHFPKIDDYGDYLFMIFRGLTSKDIAEEERQTDDDDDDGNYTRKVAIFLGKRFIVTFRRNEVSWLDAIVRQIRQYPEVGISRGTDMLAHRVIFVLVDRFERGLEVFDHRIDELEDLVVKSPEAFDMEAVLDLKRELGSLRQISRAQRLITARLASEQTPLIPKHRRRYFKDIDDRAVALSNTIEKLVDGLQAVRDAHLAFSNVRLGNTMRIMAVITTLLAPLNVIVGLYGMNFEAMPLLHSPHGFWFMVCALLGITALMLIYFRRKHWL